MKYKSLLVASALAVVLVSVFSQSAYAAPYSNPGSPGKTVYDTGNGSPGKLQPQTVTCTGTGCNGLDPAQTHCSTDVLPETLNHYAFYWSIGGGTAHEWDVQMRYSSICQTRWTRLQEIGGGHGDSLNGASGFIAISATVLGGYQSVSNVYDGAYTNMFYDPKGSTVATSFANSGSGELGGCQA